MRKDPFDFLYESKYTIDSLPEYNPAKPFKHGEDVLVAKIKGHGDGQSVHVYECRLPARFFILKVLEGYNSGGQFKPSYEISTGSGSDMGELAGKLAHAIANGMIGFSNNK